MKHKSKVCAVGLLGISSLAIAQEQQPAEGKVEEIVVIGSRIPRLKSEGPAPVTSISAQDILDKGLTSVPDVLKAVTQNNGAVQSPQTSNDFTPGAAQVNLRGLGPNHSLVLVNGRRIADFPLPLDGLSNFTDVSNIPVGMIERVDVLSGSSSAVYGSDAIAGVVNFVLKKDVEGMNISYRYGTPTRNGGGESHELSISGGFSGDKFHAVFGLELLDQRPLWAFDRSIQDSTADDPTTSAPIARRDFLRIEPNDYVYIDPGQATCASLAYFNKGTTTYGTRPGWGPWDDELEDWGDGHYCGSEKSIGYGTVISERKGGSLYGSLNYDVSDRTTLFADVLIGVSKVELFQDVTAWNYMDETGNEEGSFFNEQVGDLDNWYRQFTPEEMGGLDRGMTHSDQTSISITPGIKGEFTENWKYEAFFNHSSYDLDVSWPQIVASKANDLFLGPQLGVDEDSGLPIFDADPTRLYTPLTRAEYDSIAAYTTYHPQARTDYGSFTLINSNLFSMPAGAVGFAANFEAGSQSYDLNPDPLALEYYYFSWKDQDGHGSRTHWSGAAEFSIPLHEKLKAHAAGRYDTYHFAGNDVGEFTYNLGLEFRPIASLLVRGYYGTGFRAPDLHYVFAGSGQVESSGNDYFLCRTEEPDVDIGDCSKADTGFISSREGNRNLEPETSKSWGAGVVWSSADSNLYASLDYFNVKLEDQVVNLRIDNLLQDEADCRIGETTAGTPVDINSPTCQEAIARVQRNAADDPIAPNEIYRVHVNPINIANESTDGFDLAFRWRLPIGGASLTFDGGYTYVLDHDAQQYTGDPVIDQFAPDSGVVIPRNIATLGTTFQTGPFSATLFARYLGALQNYDEDAFIQSSTWWNASMTYKFNDDMTARLSVDNLTDEDPVRDPTAHGYPYYDAEWFDSVGRTVYFTFDYRFGGN